MVVSVGNDCHLLQGIGVGHVFLRGGGLEQVRVIVIVLIAK